MSETGSIKFTYERSSVAPIVFDALADLNVCRRKLLRLRMIGVGTDGIGFGNVSVRAPGTQSFYITGSGTGVLADLRPEHIARVTDFDFDRNWLCCEGAAVASSESLTHAAVYESDASVSAVIHGHSATLWRRWYGLAPTTTSTVEYGTPEMAREVARLFAATDVRKEKFFLMAGHVDGVVTIGGNLEEAFAILTRFLMSS